MTIRRSAAAGDQVAVLQRAALQDSRLSYRARGVLVAVLSRPVDWRTTAEQLAHEGTEGRDAIRAALLELERFGYLTRTRFQGSDDLHPGRWATEWDLTDSPATPPPNSQVTDIPAGDTGDGFSAVGPDLRKHHEPAGQADSGFPAVGRPGFIEEVETGGREQTKPVVEETLESPPRARAKSARPEPLPNLIHRPDGLDLRSLLPGRRPAARPQPRPCPHGGPGGTIGLSNPQPACGDCRRELADR